MVRDEKLRLALGDIMTSTNMEYELRQLCDVIGPRPAGSAAERVAKEYLVDRLKSYGIAKVETETFTTPYWRRGLTTCRITSPIEREISLLALPSNHTHKLKAPVIFAPFNTQEGYDLIAPSLEGKICLNIADSDIGAPLLHRRERIKLADKAGAVAFLWGSDRLGQILPTGSMDAVIAQSMPAFGISQEEILLLKRLTENHEDVILEIETQNDTRDVDSWNVVAEIPGSSDDAPIMLLTAHYDSHDITEGAFDNASGCAIVLETARVLSKYYSNQGCRVRAILFSGEEIGLKGSISYAHQHADELSQIRMMFNFDGLGVMPSTKYIHVPLRDDLIEFLRRVYHHYGYDVEIEKALALNWDHAPFAIQGVPVASFTIKRPTGSLLHYGHTSADSLDKLDLQDMRYSACCAMVVSSEVALADSWTLRRGDPEEIEKEIRAMGKGDLLSRFF